MRAAVALIGFVCGCWQSAAPAASGAASPSTPAQAEAGIDGVEPVPTPPATAPVAGGPGAAGAASNREPDAGGGPTPAADAAPGQPPDVPDADVIDACTTPIDVRAFTADGRALVIDIATAMVTWGNGPGVDRTLLPQHGAPWIERPAGCTDLYCFDRSAYEAEIFGATDTAFTVLSGFAYTLGHDGSAGTSLLNNEDVVDTSIWLNTRLGATRVLAAPVVMPNDRIEVQLVMMERWTDHAAAWRTQTAWTADASGFWLDDEVGRRMIEQGLALGRGIFLVDKGRVPGAGFDPTHADPRDVGVVAAAYPDARFVVLQSAFEHGMQVDESSRPDEIEVTADLGWGPGVGRWPEGPYDELDRDVQAKYPLDRGVNSLISSLREHGVGPHQNVYAALDGVWAEVMTRPIEAAHVIGKLLKYVGEENVLWGTQSLWYGGPRPQLEAFRGFEIPQEMQDQYGYPALTARIKAKILGLNAARLFCRMD